MSKKDITYQGLITIPVIIDDVSVNSPGYFRVTNLPTEFTSGINIFEFKGNPEVFADGSHIYIEVLDSNGEPVYYETNLNLESSTQSALVSIFINQDTAPGNGTITICGTAYKDVNGIKLNSSKVNVRWTSKIYIDPSKRNAAEIVFNVLPAVTVFSNTGSYTNLGYPGGNKFISSSLYNLEYYYRNNTPLLLTSSNSPTGFNTSSVSATLRINYNDLINFNPDLFGQINTSSIYTSSISTISGSGLIYMNNPMLFTVNNNNSVYQTSHVTVLTASIIYEQSASLSSDVTQNSYNLSTAYFSNLQPQVGTVAKIRSYYRSSGVGEYILSNETDITKQASEFGFTPNTISASFAIATVHRNDRLDFKFEFINPYGAVSKQIVESKNNLFLGGNTYIGGDDNLLTGSLYVAGRTGTGVHISGNASSAMLRSIGYSGFQNAISASGYSGFVLYSGSIQPLLGSSEAYSGVGLELVANSSSYFRYATSGSGLLDIRTSNFFLGNSTSYITSVTGAMSIYSPHFTLSTNGTVTASAIHVEKAYTDNAGSHNEIMVDTTMGILDSTNLGRVLFSTTSEFVTSSNALINPTIQYFSGSEFIFQGLKNEFRYIVSYQQRINTTSTNGGSYTGAGLRFRLYYVNSGSNTYNSWSLATQNTIDFNQSDVGGTGNFDFILSEDYHESDRRIDLVSPYDIYQGKLFKGVIDFGVYNYSPGTPNIFTASFSNITVNASRGMTSVWNNGFNSPGNLPSS